MCAGKGVYNVGDAVHSVARLTIFAWMSPAGVTRTMMTMIIIMGCCDGGERRLVVVVATEARGVWWCWMWLDLVANQ